jgi:hypothetical protein
MLSLDVCRRCDDDGSVGVGSGAGLSASSDLEATFCTAVSGVKGGRGYVIKGCAVCAYHRCQMEGEFGLEHD